MYPIYTTLYGNQVDQKLVKKLTDLELTETIFDPDLISMAKQNNISFDLPYSGDDYADFHIGLYKQEVSASGSHSENITKEDKEKYEIFIKNFIPIIKKTFVESQKEYKWTLSPEDNDLLDQFYKALQQEPKEYTAHSTS